MQSSLMRNRQGRRSGGALCVIVRMDNTVRYVSAAEAREDDGPGPATGGEGKKQK